MKLCNGPSRMKNFVHLAVIFGLVTGFVSFACTDQSKLKPEIFNNQRSMNMDKAPLPTIGIKLSPEAAHPPIQETVTPTPLSIEKESPENTLEPTVSNNKKSPVFQGKRGGTLKLI